MHPQLPLKTKASPSRPPPSQPTLCPAMVEANAGRLHPLSPLIGKKALRTWMRPKMAPEEQVACQHQDDRNLPPQAGQSQ